MSKEYIIFVDESGDHSLEKINPQYPVFALAFCIMRKVDYARIIAPSLCELKFRWFPHDQVILHEKDIVRKQGAFAFLNNSQRLSAFMDDLNELICRAPMTITTSVIRKSDLVKRYAQPFNPYDLPLLFCMEQSSDYLAHVGASLEPTPIVAEARSPRHDRPGREDSELLTTFENIVNGRPPLATHRALAKFQLFFSSKQANSAGLQIADLVARPIGLSVLRPDQPNRAMDIIRPKIWPQTGTRVKVFP